MVLIWENLDWWCRARPGLTVAEFHGSQSQPRWLIHTDT
jgi:hypothetical protein